MFFYRNYEDKLNVETDLKIKLPNIKPGTTDLFLRKPLHPNHQAENIVRNKIYLDQYLTYHCLLA